MGVDAVPELPPERGIAREDGRVVAQRLPEEHLLRSGGIARVYRGVAGGDAARHHARSSGSRTRSQVHAQNEPGNQADSHQGSRTDLGVPQDFPHTGLHSKDLADKSKLEFGQSTIMMTTAAIVPTIPTIVQNKIQASLRRSRSGDASCRGGGEASWRGRDDLSHGGASCGRGW
jgi:hypothetical protein